MPVRRWLDDLHQDLRFAIRVFGRAQRTFVLTSVVTLALAVGVTTAVFTVVSGLLLRPLPFPHAERLVAVRGKTAHPAEGLQVTNLPFYRDESRLIESFAAYDVTARYLRDRDSVERVMVVRTEPAFFSILRVPPVIGETYDGSAGPSVVVLSEGFWRRHFAGSADVVGRTVTLDDRAYTVRGIMPDSFQFPYRAGALLEGPGAQQRTDLWMPFERPLTATARLGTVVARLTPGATIASAQQELDTIAHHIPGNEGRGVAIAPLAGSIVPAAMRRLILLFFGAVIVVLVLACA
ncbi:MAG TPA: ABC transporter permease, partial [Vicinamibacterales bacterium]